jgi:hypothetical protein
MEGIRGVNVDYIIGSLLEKDLITIRGRADVVGRPMLYGTTDTFMEYLGINSLDDLPTLKAIDEIIKHSPPEGVSQSDMDFFEEINQMKAKVAAGEISTDDMKNKIREIGTGMPIDENEEEIDDTEERVTITDQVDYNTGENTEHERSNEEEADRG